MGRARGLSHGVALRGFDSVVGGRRGTGESDAQAQQRELDELAAQPADPNTVATRLRTGNPGALEDALAILNGTRSYLGVVAEPDDWGRHRDPLWLAVRDHFAEKVDASRGPVCERAWKQFPGFQTFPGVTGVMPAAQVTVELGQLRLAGPLNETAAQDKVFELADMAAAQWALNGLTDGRKWLAQPELDAVAAAHGIKGRPRKVATKLAERVHDNNFPTRGVKPMARWLADGADPNELNELLVHLTRPATTV